MLNQVNNVISTANRLMVSKYGQDIGQFSVITDPTQLSELSEDSTPGTIALAFDFCTDDISNNPTKCNEFDNDLAALIETISDIFEQHNLSLTDDFDGSSGGLYYGHYIYG